MELDQEDKRIIYEAICTYRNVDAVKLAISWQKFVSLNNADKWHAGRNNLIMCVEQGKGEPLTKQEEGMLDDYISECIKNDY